MNIQELQAERDALQKRLRSYIQEELRSFRIQTGVGISSVNVHLVHLQEIGWSINDYIVDEVQVGLEI